MQTLFAVMAPKRVHQRVIIAVDYVTPEVDLAVGTAKNLRQKFEQQGWHFWAKSVSVKQPKNAVAMRELAEQCSVYAHLMDDVTNGNSPLVDVYLDWAKQLRTAADLLDPVDQEAEQVAA